MSKIVEPRYELLRDFIADLVDQGVKVPSDEWCSFEVKFRFSDGVMHLAEAEMHLLKRSESALN